MKNIYAIAFMTEDLDGEKDLYVEVIAATSREEAIGMALDSGEGSKILARGEKLVNYNVADAFEKEDLREVGRGE